MAKALTKNADNLNSAIYKGQVRHRRFAPNTNAFNYQLYMLALDVDEVLNHQVNNLVVGESWYKPVKIKEKDYLKGEPGNLKQRISNKVVSLGGMKPIAGITMLVQARCFGLYFSPANFYFCFDHNESCLYMLVEVSNTPWNQRHYYLVDMQQPKPTEKMFHVSPFMDLDMKYHWRVKAPSKGDNSKLLVHIENRKQEQNKLFDATLALKKTTLTNGNVLRVLAKFPAMTFKIVAGIYYQALKLFLKRVPFVPYQEKKL